MEATSYVRRETICGGITNDTVLDMIKLLDGAEPLMMLMNNVTVRDVCKFTTSRTHLHEALRGLAQGQHLIHSSLMHIDLVVTINREHVPDSTIHLFGSNGRLVVVDFV